MSEVVLGKVVDMVSELALQVTAEVGVELWDLEYVRDGGNRYLRIFIDFDDGVSIDQCERVSRLIDPKLDQLDIINDGYILEVSSAGIERALKKPEHFAKFIGSMVDVKLYKSVDSSKSFSGILLSHSSAETVIDSDGRQFVFDNQNIAQVKLKPDFSKY